jgi:ribokinase
MTSSAGKSGPGRITVVGSLHYDILVTGADRPRKGETLFGEAWAWKCGGKGGNQAIEAARHGAATSFVGAVGHDGFGDALLDSLRAGGVDTNGIARLHERGSGMSVALFDAEGDYGAVIVPGSNWAISPEMLAGSPALAGCDILLLQNEVRTEVNIAAATIARTGGARVVLNAAPARDLPDELGSQLDLIVVNEIEAEMLARCEPVNTVDAAMKAAAILLATAPQVIVTLGGQGLVVATREIDPLPIAGHSVTVVSTHGAGDALIGALAARIAAGDPLTTAAQYANAAAAALVATPEARRSSLSQDATSRFLRGEGVA